MLARGNMYLCYAFLRPLWIADRLGGADPAMRAQIFRVLIAAVVAVISTLVTYLNPLIGFAHFLYLFAVDSIINDLCLAILVLTDEEGDAKAARDASGLRVGVAPDDSPGLELSDGVPKRLHERRHGRNAQVHAAHIQYVPSA